MNDSSRFLTVAEVLRIHERVVEAHGGGLELRDRGLLESAVAMPQAQFGGQYLHADFAAMAAAYLFHLCKNHPFIDGNKRVALAATELFIVLNDHWLEASDDELVELTLSVADGSTAKESLTEFVRRHIRPVQP